MNQANVEVLAELLDQANRLLIGQCGRHQHTPRWPDVIGTKAVCLPCGSELELSRDGVQTATIKQLEAWIASHREHRAQGEVVIRQTGGET